MPNKRLRRGRLILVVFKEREATLPLILLEILKSVILILKVLKVWAEMLILLPISFSELQELSLTRIILMPASLRRAEQEEVRLQFVMVEDD